MNNPFDILFEKLSNIENLLQTVVNQQKTDDDFAAYPELLSRTQAAKLLNIAKTTLDRYVREGRVKKHTKGTLVRFKKSELIGNLKTLQKWERM
jgi:excisionase family DNA binding protein